VSLVSAIAWLNVSARISHFLHWDLRLRLTAHCLISHRSGNTHIVDKEVNDMLEQLRRKVEKLHFGIEGVWNCPNYR
jgi:hypothetical protein